MISQKLIKGSCPVCQIVGDIIGAIYFYKAGQSTWTFFFECASDHFWEERELESGSNLLSKHVLTLDQLRNKISLED